MKSIICPKCKTKNNPSYRHCWKCTTAFYSSSEPLPCGKKDKNTSGFIVFIIISVAVLFLFVTSPVGIYIGKITFLQAKEYAQYPRSRQLPTLIAKYDNAKTIGDLKEKAKLAYEMASIYYEKEEYYYAAIMLSENDLSLLDEPIRSQAREIYEKLELRDPNSRMSQLVNITKQMKLPDAVQRGNKSAGH